MQENLVNDIIDLQREKKWKEIVERYHDHPDRNKLLWVFPSKENFEFLKERLQRLCCDGVLSVGCGSGLLEWMITEATGIPVSGVEIDGAWWHCKYAPPTFIPLLFTANELDKDIQSLLQESHSTALLFCYFNNRQAFNEYLKYFSGNVIVIIGPADGKGVHTDPKPFGDVPEEWKLYDSQEVRDSKDFIAIYRRNSV
ncbi:hypothetical protein ABMA28_001323 [Loxostege sticticalis]|uniref:SAM-dependent methyltransferase n=1 Tax=Loxostege sticticalis TaxID=481309 RepID=A0ABD0T1F7_LOXSC